MMQLQKIVLLFAFSLLVTGCKIDGFVVKQEFKLDCNKSAIVDVDGDAYEINYSKWINERVTIDNRKKWDN